MLGQRQNLFEGVPRLGSQLLDGSVRPTSCLTVPDAIAHIAVQSQADFSKILFRATVDTLRTIASDPRHLGAEIGFVAVLRP